jgi:DNA-directed RNA polymerase
MNTLERLTDDLGYRQKSMFGKNGKIDVRNKASVITEMCSTWLIELTYGHVLTAIERRSTVSAVIKAIGSSIMRKEKLPEDAIQACHIGWFVLISYFETGILSFKGEKRKDKNGKRDKYPTYYLRVIDADAVQELLLLIDDGSVDLFPCKEAPSKWEHQKFVHRETGIGLIKHAHEDAIKQIKTNDTSYLVDTLNKLSSTGWRINHFVFDVFKKTRYLEKTPFKFSKEVDHEKKASLLVEINAIQALAERNKDNAFYHLYNVDFRGRIYPNTAFLHEQSSDNAKGLLLLDQPVPLGEEGLYWLTVHTANMFGNDKVSLDDRAQFVQDNWNLFISYVSDPFENNGWMDVDKPLCFLACCYELYMLQDFIEEGLGTAEEFPSCLPIYIDGSNNGVQHLVAMSQDEDIAPLVNLVPQEIPGDVYMFIAEHAMTAINDLLNKVEQKKIDKFDSFFKEFQQLQEDLRNAPERTERSRIAWGELKKFKNHNFDYIGDTMSVYWSKIKDRKVWRKTLKRNVMTLAYGGTQRGMGQQIIDDTRDLSFYHRDMDVAWGYKLGRLVHGLCYEKLPGPAKMLTMFEKLAVQENEKNVPIAYTQVVTGFPFVHSYREPEKKRIKLFYGDEMLRINIQVWKEATLKKSKQKTGASPNIVHSLDAVHLTMCVHDADYPVTVVHDSFGCHAGNMNHMFTHVREKFVELYEMDPLTTIMAQMDALSLIPEKGDLDVTEVINSDYAFA